MTSEPIGGGGTSGGTAVAGQTHYNRDVVVTRVSTGQQLKFTLRLGSLVRLGRASKNEVSIDVPGVSAVHAEFVLRQSQSAPADPSALVLCLHDKSRNGVGIQTIGGDGTKKSWEKAPSAQFHELGEDCVLKVPLKSRTGDQQLPDEVRMVKVHVGPCVAAPAPAPVVQAPSQQQAATAPTVFETPQRSVVSTAAAAAPKETPNLAARLNSPVPGPRRNSNGATAAARPNGVNIAAASAPAAAGADRRSAEAAQVVEKKAQQQVQMAQQQRPLGEVSSDPIPDGRLASTLTKAALEAMAEADGARSGAGRAFTMIRDMSVSPISTPGVGRKKKRRVQPDATLDQNQPPRKKKTKHHSKVHRQQLRCDGILESPAPGDLDEDEPPLRHGARQLVLRGYDGYGDEEDDGHFEPSRRRVTDDYSPPRWHPAADFSSSPGGKRQQVPTGTSNSAKAARPKGQSKPAARTAEPCEAELKSKVKEKKRKDKQKSGDRVKEKSTRKKTRSG